MDAEVGARRSVRRKLPDHDTLMQKAVGWMLSYAIEKFDEEERKEWMKFTPLRQ
jgi:3-methyladenine DNA glycosylase AlkD